MKALVEIVGKKAMVILFDDVGKVVMELETRYNKAVRGADAVDWKYTDYSDENMFAKFSDWSKQVFWFAADVQEGRG